MNPAEKTLFIFIGALIFVTAVKFLIKFISTVIRIRHIKKKHMEAYFNVFQMCIQYGNSLLIKAYQKYLDKYPDWENEHADFVKELQLIDADIEGSNQIVTFLMMIAEKDLHEYMKNNLVEVAVNTLENDPSDCVTNAMDAIRSVMSYNGVPHNNGNIPECVATYVKMVIEKRLPNLRIGTSNLSAFPMVSETSKEFYTEIAGMLIAMINRDSENVRQVMEDSNGSTKETFM